MKKVLMFFTILSITLLQAAQVSPKKLYINECGSCHMAYQPQFLPKRSWLKMMNTLEDHFKTDASLDKDDKKIITSYLVKNSGDSKRVYKEFRKFNSYISKNSTPLRISETYYFKKEHRKIPKRFIYQKEVKSLSNCNACHTKAEKGMYNERTLFIPNYGRWDD